MKKSLRNSTTSRLLIALRLIGGMMFTRVRESLVRASDLLIHLSLYRRQTGEVIFNVEVDEADGFVRHLVHVPHEGSRMEVTTFRLLNRWVGNRRGKPAARLAWTIKTAAETTQDIRVLSVVWGVHSWKQVEVRPFDLTRLPSDEEIRARLRLRLRMQAFLAKHFPATEQPNGLSIRDAARDIILR